MLKGIAFPIASLAKSWSFTLYASFCHDVPGFLKLPTCSFFFPSQLIIGMPRCACSSRLWLMYANCRLRTAGEGEFLPPDSILLWFTRREYLMVLRSRATVFELTVIPSRVNCLAIFCVVLLVHFNPVIGSPAVSCSNSFAIDWITSGVFFPAPVGPLPCCERPPTGLGCQIARVVLEPPYGRLAREIWRFLDLLRARA